MRITVEKGEAGNIADVNRCDGEFVIDAKLVLQVENEVIKYTVRQLPPSTKRYKKDDFVPSTYLNQADKAFYLAYVDGQIAGQIFLRINWNRFAYIEDMCVEPGLRRNGVGKALMGRAMQWAKEHNLPGIMLETQDNNVVACRFYESCGFQLRGFDTYLYKAVDPGTEEVALYFYCVFGEQLPGEIV